MDNDERSEKIITLARAMFQKSETQTSQTYCLKTMALVAFLSATTTGPQESSSLSIIDPSTARKRPSCAPSFITPRKRGSRRLQFWNLTYARSLRLSRSMT